MVKDMDNQLMKRQLQKSLRKPDRKTHTLYTHTMILANVLVGHYAPGLRSYRRPPPRHDPNDELALYDSCVDAMIRPNIYVIFDSNKVYPQYVIQYLTEQKPE